MNILLKIGLAASVGIGSLCALQRTDEIAHYLSAIISQSENPTEQRTDEIAHYLLATTSQSENPTELSAAEALTVWSGEAARANELLEQQANIEVYVNRRKKELDSNFRKYHAYLVGNLKFLVATDRPYEVFSPKLTEVVSLVAEVRNHIIKSFGYKWQETACECGLVTLLKLLDPLMIHISKATTTAERDQLINHLTKICETYQNYCVLCLHPQHNSCKAAFDLKASLCSARLQTM